MIHLLAFANSEGGAMRSLLTIMLLAAAMLPALSYAQTVDICGRTPQVRDEILLASGAGSCAAVTPAQLAGVALLCFSDFCPQGITYRGRFDDYNRPEIAAIKPGDFAGLTGLTTLDLAFNGLAALPEGVFAGLTSLQRIHFTSNRLAALPEGVFAGLTSLESLSFFFNELTALPEGVFAGLTNLGRLRLSDNKLTALPEGVFAGLTSLESLSLDNNELTALPEGVFAGLTNLGRLRLSDNRLTTLPEGVFAGPNGLTEILLDGNQLAVLPNGVFAGQTFLTKLTLECNPIAELLSRRDPLFADLPSGATIQLTSPDGCRSRKGYLPAGVPPVYLTTGAGATGVPFFAPSSHPMRQGFLRILNTQTTRGEGALRVTAFNDAGETVGPAELPFKRLSGTNYTAADIMEALELPAGNWRFKVDSYWQVSMLSYVRTNDGFLAPAHDALQRNDEGRLVVPLFNPASNEKRVGQLRLVNTGEDAAEASIEGFDDEGNAAGPVTLTLAAGETRTLSALELEQGGEGLAGTLGDGNGKWRLLVKATPSVVGLNLLEATSGHLTNLSTMGRPAGVAAVPLLEAGASTRSGFVRIVNQTASAGMVRVTAVDDMGNAANPFDLAIAENGAIHFNAGDLADGNMGKGVPALGRPVQGDWRLNVETELDVRVLSYVRANDGYLAPLHDLMERETNDRRKRLVAPIFMPPGGDAGTSLLRLVNTGEDAAQVNAVVFTDQPSNGLSLIFANFELAAGEARTLSALDLNNMAERPLEGDNYWYLKIEAGPSVLGMNLLESNSGHLANLSTMGGARWQREE